MKKLNDVKAWKELTKPFREAAKRSGFTNEDLNKLIEESKLYPRDFTKNF